MGAGTWICHTEGQKEGIETERRGDGDERIEENERATGTDRTWKDSGKGGEEEELQI